VVILDCPGLRLSKSNCTASTSIGIPEGQPSIIPPIALPWDSPKLVKRNIFPNEFELIENKNRKMLGLMVSLKLKVEN
jgi:hypothetical protein